MQHSVPDLHTRGCLSHSSGPQHEPNITRQWGSWVGERGEAVELLGEHRKWWSHTFQLVTPISCSCPTSGNGAPETLGLRKQRWFQEYIDIHNTDGFFSFLLSGLVKSLDNVTQRRCCPQSQKKWVNGGRGEDGSLQMRNWVTRS